MPRHEPTWIPSERFDEAFAHARRLHRSQSRKTAASDGGEAPPGAPYIGHLLSVAGIVIDHGGTETQAIAGLLHDSIEDTEADSEEKLAALVGAEVAAIVRACTDVDDPDQKDRERALCTCRRADAWWDRKRAYLEHLATKTMDDPSVLVALADKVHNAETTASGLGGSPAADRAVFWSRFNTGAWHQQLWYRGLVEAFATNKDHDADTAALHARLARAVDTMFALSPAPASPPECPDHRD